MNTITMTLQADHLILEALKEDISRRSRTDLQAGRYYCRTGCISQGL